MSAPRLPINKATHSVGFHAKLGVIKAITADGQFALVVDRQDTETRVPMLVQRSKAPLPAVGETWLLDQSLGNWTFAAFVGKAVADFIGSTAASSSVFVSPTPPGGGMAAMAMELDAAVTPLVVGDLWIDTSSGNEVSAWNGTTWIALQFGTGALADQAVTAAKIAPATITAAQIAPGAGITADQVAFTVTDIGGTKVFTGTSQPTGMSPGDVWINPAQGNMMSTWDGHRWNALQIGAPAIQPASIGASQINFTAKDIGGLTVSVSASAPSGAKIGDLWYDAGNGYVLEQWNGAAWVPYQFGTNAISAGSVTAALIAANTITASQIAAGAITAATIAAGAIAAGLLDANAIDGMTINGAVINGATISAADLIVSAGDGGLFVYSGGANTVKPFTTIGSHNWTCPPGVTSVLVETWAAGGGGAYNNTGDGGSGAGGAYAASTISVTPGVTYTIVIGAHGTGGTSGTPNGGTGGDTTWQSTVVVAKGGGGGAPSAGGAHQAGSTGTTVFQGGDGVVGVGGVGGGGAGSGGNASNGNNGNANGSAAAAVTGGGPGGVGATATTAANDPSVGPGGGGGGGAAGTHPNGAQGSIGRAQLTYTAGSATLIGSIAGMAGSADPVAGSAYPEGAQFDVIRDSSHAGNRVMAAQYDNSSITVVATSPQAATTAWSIPAKDADTGTVYELTAEGHGTWGNPVQSMGVDLGLDGTGLAGGATLDSSTFTVGEAFNFEFTGRIEITATGGGGTCNWFFKLLASSNSSASQNGYTMIRRATGAAFDTTASHTLGLLLDWASATGSPTVTCTGSIFEPKGD